MAPPEARPVAAGCEVDALGERAEQTFDGGTRDTRFKVRLGERAELATVLLPGVDDLAWLVEQRTSGRANGTKLSERITDTRTTVDALPGWKLRFTLTGSDGATSGSLELANGRSVALTGKQSFDSSSNICEAIPSRRNWSWSTDWDSSSSPSSSRSRASAWPMSSAARTGAACAIPGF